MLVNILGPTQQYHLLMNMHTLIERAGTKYIASAYTAIVFSALLPSAAIAVSSQIDRFGWKVWLTISCTLTGICLLTISVYFHFYLGLDVLRVSWIPIVAIMVYTDSVFIVGGIISIIVYQMLEPYGLYIPFYVFTFCSFVVIMFTICFVPETKFRRNTGVTSRKR